MTIIKYIMLISVFLICSYLGKLKSNSFNKRYEELKKIKRSYGIFRSKLEFTYAPIGEVFSTISKIVYCEQDNIFKRFLENNDWDYSVDVQNNLEKDDKEAIKSFGKMLGKLDKDGQLNEIYLAEKFVDKQIEIAFEQKQKNEKLYSVLGKVVGIAIAIILF